MMVTSINFTVGVTWDTVDGTVAGGQDSIRSAQPARRSAADTDGGRNCNIEKTATIEQV